MEYTPSKENNQENDIINNNIEQNNLFNNSPLKLYCSDISEIDKQNENGWTPIYRSIIANNLNVLSDLLKLGANPNLQNNIGETPLYLCVDIDNYEAIIILLQKPNLVTINFICASLVFCASSRIIQAPSRVLPLI